MISTVDNKPIKILQVFGCMNRGGAEMRTVEMLHRVDRQQFHPHFLSLSGRPGQLDDEIRNLGSKVHFCKLGRGFAGRFNALLHKERFDIVHSHVHFASGYILRLAEKAGIRGRIAHFRSVRDGKAATPRRIVQRIFLRRLVNRHATRILAVGEGTMTTLFGNQWHEDPRRIVIPNGTDESRFADPPDRVGVRLEFGLQNDCPLVIHVGNFRKPKNHALLIRVFAEIIKQLPRARLLLVGQGGTDVEMKVRRQVERLRIDGSVVFAGLRSDVPRLLAAADVMIFPSKWEGLPGVVLEAAAAGIPVIGSSIPGIAELAGHLSQVQCLGLDLDAAIWAQTACDLLRHESKNQSKRAARKTHFLASPFTIEKCAAATCSVWQEAVLA